MGRAHNFNAGPSALPLEVLRRAQAELIDYQGTGMSVMELSHRSETYEAIHRSAQDRLRRLLGVPDNYRVLFLQGGASLQFAMLPMNYLSRDAAAAYVLTGSWSEKAAQEARRFGRVQLDSQAKEDGYKTIPEMLDGEALAGASYVHITSNNTIYGTQWHAFPTTQIPLVADMSSDIMSHEVDVEQFHMIYAGAQKNLGPSGVTVVIVRDEWLQQANQDIPTMLQYGVHAKADSLYNTPPTFAIYLMDLVLEWIEEQGGLTAIASRNAEKSGLIYSVIDEYPDLFDGHAAKSARSHMNVTFRLPSDEQSKEFLAQAKALGFVGVKGHRSVGGCRVSLYNAVPVESAARFAEFMRDYARKSR
ncbi:3-phosphoserine/phosphohydroxythreonine transaminase [Alicyclobacillus dauci]|uniref:Phosphoserine aminotransferase n=1 Tax=Alicyclobacillus dauci TaxID=1475485 RepID=A0ABY6YZL3_9BACL|nr:3-phosphoserine/phosphohydroxythreonine transaminase [Alicyclobacillus dauci]WAH35556.1 3-phosphoserine/phosphohydroxythreonine transaminase [Alicyclobacillus dauci]